MSKYLAIDKDIPSNFSGIKNATAKSLMANIQAERKEEAYEAIVAENPEQIPNLELTDDFELARKNITALLEISAKAINDYYDFATTSSSPKAVEVLSSMIKDTVEMNKNLIEIHQQRERIKRTKIDNGSPTSLNDTPTQNNINTQNNIMCSPSDLAKLMKETEKQSLTREVVT